MKRPLDLDDYCARCERRAVDDIYCAAHAAVAANEWTCDCGQYIGSGRTKVCPECGQRKAAQ